MRFFLYIFLLLCVYVPFVFGFEVIDSSTQQLKNARAFSWYIDVDVIQSYQLLDKNITKNMQNVMYYHNAKSVQAFANTIENKKKYILENTLNTQGLHIIGTFSNQYFSYSKAHAFAQILQTYPLAKKAWINSSAITYDLAYHPSDECYYYQSYTGIDTLHAYATTKVNTIWRKISPLSNTAIAFFDTGKVDHIDFGQRSRLSGRDYIANPLQSGDGDGRDNDPTDVGFSQDCRYSSGYHGNHVSSIATAKGDNGLGIAGINWQADIIHMRVIGPRDGSSSDIANALTDVSAIHQTRQQINRRVGVANLSLGSSVGKRCEDFLVGGANVLGELLQNNILVVVAAGNNHADAQDYALSNCPYVMSVAATNHKGGKAYYSNYGPAIDIAAPGGEIDAEGDKSYAIAALVNANRYEYKQGTSMATPIVSGIASLAMNFDTTVHARDLYHILLATATPFRATDTALSCDTFICGTGIVNAQGAIEHIEQKKRYIFFPRQTQYYAKNAVANIEIMLSRQSEQDTYFNVQVTAEGCTVDTNEYTNLRIPAGEYSYTMYFSNTKGCDTMQYFLSVAEGNNVSLNTKDNRHISKVFYIDENNFEFEIKYNNIYWQYMKKNKQNGNAHLVSLSKPGQYKVSTISDMDLELEIRKYSDRSVLYSSQKNDPSNLNVFDSFIHFFIDSNQIIDISVIENTQTASKGGLYAISVVRVPYFSEYPGLSNNVCPVQLGIDSGVCSGNPTSPNTVSSVSSEEKKLGSSSLSLYCVLGLFFLVIFAYYEKNIGRYTYKNTKRLDAYIC